MGQLTVKAPDGTVGTIDASEAQAAANAGYVVVDVADARAAAETARTAVGEDAAVTQGLVQAPRDYDVGQAFDEKALSALTFGQAPGLASPEARARGQRFQEEHPGQAFGAEVLGQLPLAVAGGAVGGAAVSAARGLGTAARAGVAGLDFAAQSALGGAQTEAEIARLSGEDFSWTDAAITGAAGEVLGRGAAWSISKGLGGARNLLAKGEREIIAADAEKSLSRGGWVGDYKVAQHAEAYHAELSDLAARDFDQLETAFEEVSRQDRKRARIMRSVVDSPVQHEVAIDAAAGMRRLQNALADELGEAPAGPAKKLAKQLDDRVALLESGVRGKKLWKALDENRQALQEYRQDLYQAYENNPGSAWLSREGLAAIDAAEKVTRESLLREDAWGAAAAEAQRAYNVPFHEKYFPAVNTVRGKLQFSPHKNAEGFAVFRGDPEKLRAFFTRDLAAPDGARLGEQFSQYLEGVEAIARAGELDSPAAARQVLESVRRLRKAHANALQVSAAAQRTARRAGGINQAAMVAGGVAGLASGGLGAAAVGGLAIRGLRVGDWLGRVGPKLGWGAGEALSMADLLAKDALPAAKPRAVAEDVAEDLFESPFRRTDVPPPPRGGAVQGSLVRPVGEPAPGAPEATPGVGPGARSAARAPQGAYAVTPDRIVSVGPAGAPQGGRAVQPDGVVRVGGEPPGPAGALAPEGEARVGTMADDPDAPLSDLGPEYQPPRVGDRAERATRDTQPLGDRDAAGSEAAAHFDGAVDPGRGARSAEAAALSGREWDEAMTEAEFQDIVDAFRALDVDAPDGGKLADALEDAAPALRAAGDVVPDAPAPRAEAAPSAPAPHAGTPGAQALADLEALGVTQSTNATAAAEQRLQENLAHVFGGTPPTAEQWRQLVPLHLLSVLDGGAKPTHARIRAYGRDGFTWEAEGAPYSDPSYKISRTYTRDSDGHFEVHHDHFYLSEDAQKSGVGGKVIKSQFEAYTKLGVDEVTVDCVEVGQYFWPSIGFNHPDAGIVDDAVDSYKSWLMNNKGLSELEARQAVRGVMSLPSLAQTEYGKDFLLQVSGPWNFGLSLKLDEADPMFHLMRGRLDIELAALAALGGYALEGSSAEDAGPHAGAAAAGVLGLTPFGRRVGLFKAARAKLTNDVARRLITGVAGATVKSVARLSYSRAQMEARQKEFQDWAQNPQALVERVAEGFRDVPPEHSGTAAGGLFRTATFLKEKLPIVARLNAVSLRQIPVSSEAAAKYALYEHAALQPREALQAAAQAGYIHEETLETLQALLPDLLAELRVAAYLAIREGGPPTTIQGRLSYARLFDGAGEAADPAFSLEVARMAELAYQNAVPTKTAPAGGTPGVSRQAQAVAAPAWGSPAS